MFFLFVMIHDSCFFRQSEGGERLVQCYVTKKNDKSPVSGSCTVPVLWNRGWCCVGFHVLRSIIIETVMLLTVILRYGTAVLYDSTSYTPPTYVVYCFYLIPGVHPPSTAWFIPSIVSLNTTTTTTTIDSTMMVTHWHVTSSEASCAAFYAFSVQHYQIFRFSCDNCTVPVAFVIFFPFSGIIFFFKSSPRLYMIDLGSVIAPTKHQYNTIQ